MSLGDDLRLMAEGFRWGHRNLAPRSAQLSEPGFLDSLPGSRRFPTDWARAPWAQAVREAVLRFGFAPLLRHELRGRIEGVELLNELQPPVIFIANHSSHLDAPMILTSLPRNWQRRIAVGAAADYFFDAWWRAAGTTLAFNAFPVERTGARKTAGVGDRLIREGWSLLMFPEGTRSKDGWMGEFKHGTATLAIESRVPVAPIALRGNYQAMPRGRGWPAPGRPPVSLRFGRPVHPKPGEQPPEFTARMLSALEQTLHEDSSNWWTALKTKLSHPSAANPPDVGWRRRWESSRPLQDPDAGRVWR